MMKHVPDKFKKLTIIVPPPTDEMVVAIVTCPKPGKHRSS